MGIAVALINGMFRLIVMVVQVAVQIAVKTAHAVVRLTERHLAERRKRGGGR